MQDMQRHPISWYLSAQVVMAKENREFELKRLRDEVEKAHEDEVFGGLSTAERAEYDRKIRRINELEIEQSMSAVAEKKSQSSKAKQRSHWNRRSDTDIPQGKAQQPYASREKDSANAFADPTRNRGQEKNPTSGKRQQGLMSRFIERTL
jgi:hypothetical protein